MVVVAVAVVVVYILEAEAVLPAVTVL